MSGKRGFLLLQILAAPRERLGLFRAILGVYLFLHLVIQSPLAWQTMTSQLAVFEPVGLLALLGGQSAPPFSVALGLYGATIFGTVFFAWGAYYRVTGPLTALGLLWVTSYKCSFGMLFHSENLFTLHALLIGFAPAARGFSYDQYRAPKTHDDSTSPRNESGWPLLFCALVTIGAYVLAGIAKWKLSGVGWAMGDVLRAQVAFDNVRKIELGSVHSPLGAWSVSHAWLFPPLGMLTLLAECAGPLALLHKRVALIWAALIMSFHWGVLILMAITFPYPLFGVPFLCLFRLEETKWGKLALARYERLRSDSRP